MFEKENIEQALRIKIDLTPEQVKRQNEWRKVLAGEAPWNDEDNPSLLIAAGACSETARAATIELETEATGSPRADYLNEQYQRVVDDLRQTAEVLCGNGRFAFRPFIRKNEIRATIAVPGAYYPLKYNEVGELIAAIFVDTIWRDKKYYTLLEKGIFSGSTYTIENTAWVSDNENDLGKQIPLASMPEWADLPESIQWPESNGPWFVEIKMPGNGEPLFSRAIGLIKQADRQFGRTVWEFEGGELALDVNGDLLKKDERGDYVFPKGRKRLFRAWKPKNDQTGFGVTPFSPQFRDVSLFNGLNNMLRKIEFNCGLSYGTLSDPQNVDRTATEVKASKQRFYQTVADIQAALETGLRSLLEIMDDMATRYDLAPQGSYDTSFWWDDSIIVDAQQEQADYDAELKRLVLLRQNNIVSDAQVLAFVIQNSNYFSKLTEQMIADAAKMLPGPFDE